VFSSVGSSVSYCSLLQKPKPAQTLSETGFFGLFSPDLPLTYAKITEKEKAKKGGDQHFGD